MQDAVAHEIFNSEIPSVFGVRAVDINLQSAGHLCSSILPDLDDFVNEKAHLALDGLSRLRCCLLSADK